MLGYEQPDFELRRAIVGFYEAKGYKVSFMVNYKIESCSVFTVEHNDKKIPFYFITPKRTKKQIVIGFPGYTNCYTISDLQIMVEEQKSREQFLFKKYKEPFPGAFGSNPYSGGKKYKNKRGRK